MVAVQKRNGRGGARRGAGAKPKVLADRRRNRVVLNLTDSELREVRGAAEGRQLSAFIREVLFRSLARRRK